MKNIDKTDKNKKKDIEKNLDNNDLKQIKELLKQNLELTQEVKEMLRKIKRHMLWSKIWSILKISLIVVPIILGFIYLPPLIQKYVDKIKDSIGITIGGEDADNEASINIEDIPPELLQKYLK